MSILEELKRRNVIRAGGAYLVGNYLSERMTNASLWQGDILYWEKK